MIETCSPCSVEMPLVWLVSATLMVVWTARLIRKICPVFDVRADLEARVNLLRKGRKFQNCAAIIEDLILNSY